MTRTPRPARWLHRAWDLVRNTVWSGAGVVVRKRFFDSGVGAGTLPVDFVSVRVTGVAPARWVLVMKDAAGQKHCVDVDRAVWDAHQVGDVITADNPLIQIPSSSVLGTKSRRLRDAGPLAM